MTTFRPAWWLRNRHGQTVWRKLFARRQPLHYRRERWDTPDGDFLDVDWSECADSGRDAPLVLVFHGLEGSSRAPYVAGLFNEATRLGWDGAALNFRSCSGELNRRPRFYHSGETEDLHHIISSIVARYPGRPLGLVGYSLGGNALLKWLGEQGEKAPQEVMAAVAVSVPFDLEAAAHRIDHGFGRLYGQAFLRTLKVKALAKARAFPGLLSSAEVSSITSFATFDDRVTAPLHGFVNGKDYWTRSSATPWLAAIRRPTLLINACDDPFVPRAALPSRAVEASSWLHGEFSDRGGHVGFVEGVWPGAGRYWADHRVMRFLGDKTDHAIPGRR